MGRKSQTEGENEMPRIFILLVNSKHKDEKKGAGRVKKKKKIPGDALGKNANPVASQ